MDKYYIEAMKEVNQFLDLDEWDGLEKPQENGYMHSAGVRPGTLEIIVAEGKAHSFMRDHSLHDHPEAKNIWYRPESCQWYYKHDPVTLEQLKLILHGDKMVHPRLFPEGSVDALKESILGRTSSSGPR